MQTGVLSTNAGSGNNLKVDQHLRLGPTERSVFRKVSEGALFLPDANDDKSPLVGGGFSCLSDSPPTSPTGVASSVQCPAELLHLRPVPILGSFPGSRRVPLLLVNARI